MAYALYGILLIASLLALIRPVWSLIAVMIVELSLYGYIPGTSISARFGTALASGLMAMPMIFRTARWGDGRLRLVLIPAALFLAVATVVNLFFSDFDYVFKYLRWQILQLIALLLAASVIRSSRDLKLAAGIALAFAVVSALLAAWQHMSPSSAPYNGMSVADAASWGGRGVGLVKSPVLLANQLTFVLLPVIGLLVCGAHRADNWQAALAAFVSILTAGLYLTFTRSALLAVGPGLLVLAIYARGLRRTVLVGVILAMPIAYMLLQGTGLIGERYEREIAGDKSAASHVGMFQVGVELALDNWMVGIGHEWFEEESTAYLHVVDSDIVQAGGTRSIGEARVHNDFLSVWFSWGVTGIIAYLAIFVGSMVNFNAAAQSRDPVIRGLAVGCAGGVVTYAVNSAFHNYLDASAVLWLYAGLSVTLTRLAKATPIALRRRRLAFLRFSRSAWELAARS